MYLVTGATGNVGSNVVDHLLAQDQQVRVFTRDPARASAWGDRVQIAIGDFTHLDTFTEAVQEVEGIFLMNATTPIDAFQQLLEAATASKISRIAFLSSIAASEPETMLGKLHLEKEDAIRSSGISNACLRPGGFMSNAYGWAPTIRSESIVYNPMGSGLYAPIAPEDIASVAAQFLVSSDVSSQTYNLTGGQLITTPQQVEVLSELLERPLQVIEISTEATIEHLVRSGIPRHIATGVARSFENIREGRAAQAFDTLQQLLGRPPLTFKDWAERHIDKFA
jgi:uncharacterized protein YbjT (DUF2867 family)